MKVSRRTFCQSGTSGLLFCRSGWAQNQFGIRNCGAEWACHSAKRYADPFNEIELDVIFRTPESAEQRVPAFWGVVPDGLFLAKKQSIIRLLLRLAQTVRRLALQRPKFGKSRGVATTPKLNDHRLYRVAFRTGRAHRTL